MNKPFIRPISLQIIVAVFLRFYLLFSHHFLIIIIHHKQFNKSFYYLSTELPQGILVVAIGIRPQVSKLIPYHKKILIVVALLPYSYSLFCHFQVRFAMTQLSNIIDLLSLLNSSVNFILYATMSNLFRHEFLQTVCHLFNSA
jgi:hypothetical protein